MRAVREIDVPISLHEEDPALIGKPGINDGEVSAALGFAGAPKVSESSMVARDCMLALDTGAKVHMQHLSCAESVAAVRLAKELGAKVTAEATPQHFSLTEKAVLEKGALAKLNPPLRGEDDRYAVIAGLKDGTIDMIATDHAPHSDEEKARPLTEAPSGLTGLETALALGITNLVRKGHLSLSGLIEKMTLAPARLYGFDAGYLAEGAPADIAIFDDRERWIVSDFASKANNSPFVGWTLLGKVKYTVCRGKVVYQDE
jgi:dihydroorotase